MARKENEANDATGDRSLFQQQTHQGENDEAENIPSPRVNRIINDNYLPEDRDEPKSTTPANESLKVRVIPRRGDDMLDLSNLQELSASIQFIEAFNKNSEV